MKKNLIRRTNSFKEAKKFLEEKNLPISISGLVSESFSPLAKEFFEDEKQMLILTRDEYRAKKITEELKLLNLNVEYFSKRDIVFYDIEAKSREYSYERIKIIRKIINKDNLIVVAPIESLYDKYEIKENFKKNYIEIKVKRQYDLQKLIKTLISMGYERVEMIEGKGQISLRGGILDIFSIDSNTPVRIEFFDDEVDSIRMFDIETKRSKDNLESTFIETLEEISYSIEDLKNIKNNLEKKLSSISKSKDTQKNLEEKFKRYLEKIEDELYIENKDILVPFSDKDFDSVIDFFDNDTLVFIEDVKRAEERFIRYYEDFQNSIRDYVLAEEVFLENINSINEKNKLLGSLKLKKNIFTSNLLSSLKLFKPKSSVNFQTKSIINYRGDINLFKDDIETQLSIGKKIYIFSENEDKAKNITKDILNLGIKAVYYEDIRETEKLISVLPFSIPKGFEIIETGTILISFKDIFLTKKKKNYKKLKSAKKINSFTDLKAGDYVVHENHGIGKYKGVEQLNVEGIKKDYLIIEYSGGDKLYIPIDQMNLIQKYIGSDFQSIKVNKLGGTEWNKTKNKVKKAIEDMANDLIKLYAQREVTKGFKFSKDTPWQVEFEEQFPYEETYDQIRSIKEIKNDMEKEEPMDRLLCGDVGYGKTEVALRAAFKAVMDSKQVAFLVPTTILAEQHYKTMKERFENFPIKIACLNRFRTKQDAENIKKALEYGSLDIVVGTHKLLAKDINYKDLGLLIIDEEQRFGVKQKESIKQIKKSVDVLTLSATPIPRTLHMSLSGIRDMSLLEEPPGERYPIQTYVLEFNENLIRDAILKEISRNGQVYILYNKVKSMENFTSKIKKIVPEAIVAMANGQMSEAKLEKIMDEFLDKKYDVLICTTIIETGLDIPNVNTIIINDSDKMGLSQLYQLRGRVGRSEKIAFSYFLYQKDKVLTELSEKRLKTIKEFTEFGSGFKIAMRDLEIRGAGNLLGREQHGQMASIGYDLYVKFLDSAIKKLKGYKEEKDIETNVDLNISGYIREDYIKESQKIEIYKKISLIENEEQKSELIDELIDIYGDIPKEVNNLIEISLIKNLANKKKFSQIKQIKNKIFFTFKDEKDISDNFIEWLVKNYSSKIEFKTSKQPQFAYKLESKKEKDILKELIDFLENMNKK